MQNHVHRAKDDEFDFAEFQIPEMKKPATRAGFFIESIGVADGARTHDNRNHNPGLYQLSYSHH
jgi:hypothetical protein